MKYKRCLIDQHFGKFLIQQFVGKQCCYIVFDLNLYSIPSQFKDGEALKIARKFRNNLSRFYYGNAARKQKRFAAVAIHLHRQPNTHFHIIAEVPGTTRFDHVRSFTETFVTKNFPICVPRKKTRNGTFDEVCYFAPINNLVGASFYNNRFGYDTCLLF